MDKGIRALILLEESHERPSFFERELFPSAIFLLIELMVRRPSVSSLIMSFYVANPIISQVPLAKLCIHVYLPPFFF
jgi:hypothetical protein